MRNSTAIWIPTSSAQNNQSTGYIPALPSLLWPSGDSLPAPSCLSFTTQDRWDTTNPGYTSSTSQSSSVPIIPSAASHQCAFRNSSTPPVGLSQFPAPSPSLRSRISMTATNIQCGFLIHGNRWGQSGEACHSLSHMGILTVELSLHLPGSQGRNIPNLFPKIPEFKPGGLGLYPCFGKEGDDGRPETGKPTKESSHCEDSSASSQHSLSQELF